MCSLEIFPDAVQWSPRLSRWSLRLRAARLDGVIGTLLDVLEPFGPLGAQVLWVAQPTLRLLVPGEDITALARLLEAPGGVAWLREQLTGMDDHDR